MLNSIMQIKEEIKGEIQNSRTATLFIIRYISPHTYYYYLTNTDFEGKVRLTFDDFDIHQESKLVVIDGDSSTSFYSWSQRPVYESKSRKIQINYISSMEFWDKLDVWVIKTGFKITYEFVSADGSWDVKPDTGCDATEKDGGLLVLHSTPRFGAATGAGRGGGAGRREAVLSAGGNVNSWQPLDCIWVIKPSSYDNAVYAKLLQLKSAVTSSFNRLDIREGVNSVAPLLLNLQDSLNYPVDGANGGIPTEFVSRTGFYIRLSMVYSKLDLFEMVYARYDMKRESLIYRSDILFQVKVQTGVIQRMSPHDCVSISHNFVSFRVTSLTFLSLNHTE